MKLELFTRNGDTLYYPAVESSVEWSLERKGIPGKLTFSGMQDGGWQLAEGDPVVLRVDGVDCFYGFAFTLKPDRDGLVKVTAYDQLRYLKNKDTYVYSGKRADEAVRMLAADFQLRVGTLENTGYIIPSRTEDDSTLFDIVQSALDLTLQNTGRLFVLYDEFGKLMLRDVEHMLLDVLIASDTGQEVDYSSSIDGNTYNKIKLRREDQDAGEITYYLAHDVQTIGAWGVLQMTGTVEGMENGQAKADALLRLYNTPARTLSVKGCFGDVRVRAGSSVFVQLDLAGAFVAGYMLVEKVRHKFEEEGHTMDLTLRGGMINAV